MAAVTWGRGGRYTDRECKRGEMQRMNHALPGSSVSLYLVTLVERSICGFAGQGSHTSQQQL